MYYLDFHQLYSNPTKKERADVRQTLDRDTVMALRLKYQHDMCFYCGVPIDMSSHLDHVIPVRYGGSNRSSNLVAACRDCNMTKMTDQIEITNPNTINDYLRKQITYKKWITRIQKYSYDYSKFKYLVDNPPKKVNMAIKFRADLFKEI